MSYYLALHIVQNCGHVRDIIWFSVKSKKIRASWHWLQPGGHGTIGFTLVAYSRGSFRFLRYHGTSKSFSSRILTVFKSFWKALILFSCPRSFAFRSVPVVCLGTNGECASIWVCCIQFFVNKLHSYFVPWLKKFVLCFIYVKKIIFYLFLFIQTTRF